MNWEHPTGHTVKKQIFLIYKEIQQGSGAKSYMRKGFLIYEEMRKYLVIYGDPISHIWLYTQSLLNFLIYRVGGNFLFFLTVQPSVSQSIGGVMLHVCLDLSFLCTVRCQDSHLSPYCNLNPIYVFLFWELRGLSPNFHIHVSATGLNIRRIGPHIWLQQNRQTDPGKI